MHRQDYSAGEAARLLGISVDTLRRWDSSGRIRVERDAANRRRVPASEIERIRSTREELAGLSARNRLPGVVRVVRSDGVVATVEIEVRGPVRVLALITSEAVEDLGLVEGVAATAVVKATSVMLDR